MQQEDWLRPDSGKGFQVDRDSNDVVTETPRGYFQVGWTTVSTYHNTS